MVEAAWWGFVGGVALLAGAVTAMLVHVSTRVVGLVLGFGAGVLISAASFELTEEAFRAGGTLPAVGGLLAGSLAFYVGDRLIDRRGGEGRKDPRHGGVTSEVSDRMQGGAAPTVRQATASTSGLALVLGALLDGIPESAAVGISLLGGGGVSAAVVLAVVLSNVPESLSATTGLLASGRSRRWVLALWSAVVVASTLAALLGYALLGDASPGALAAIQTFAAGAILTMVADTMLPEAVEHAGRSVGIVTVAGFVLSFLVGATGG
ncbi:MAG: ZIP family metal transporter [Phycicoccus sp.]